MQSVGETLKPLYKCHTEDRSFVCATSMERSTESSTEPAWSSMESNDTVCLTSYKTPRGTNTPLTTFAVLCLMWETLFGVMMLLLHLNACLSFLIRVRLAQRMISRPV